MPRAKSILLLVLFNVLFVLLIVYAFEFFFSPYSSLPSNGYIAGERYTWGHLVQNNKFGFRERNITTPKPADLHRILVVGDSLTWGAGLAIEERYTSITEKILNESLCGRKFEVLNFAVSGGPTTKERDIIVEFKDIVVPDRIVVGFSFNDPQPKAQNYSVERDKLSSSIVGRTIDSISEVMIQVELPYVGRLLNQTFYRLAEKIDLIPTWQVALNRTYQTHSNEWQEFVRALKEIKSISDELDLPPPIFAVLNAGKRAHMFFNYNGSDTYMKMYLQWYHQAEKTARDIGFIAYNHEYEIAGQLANESLVVNVLDGHPSANLNRIYGEKLYRVIANQVIQDSKIKHCIEVYQNSESN